MNRIPILLLRTLIVLVGVAVFAFLIWEPQIEGRNLNATLFEVYFQDLFLWYMYIASIPFFAILYQLFKLLGYVGHKKIFTSDSMKALEKIKECSVYLSIFALGAVLYFILFQSSKGEDIAGGVAIGLFVFFASLSTAVIAALFERKLENFKS